MFRLFQKNHRGRLFVDPKFQGRLLLRLAIYWLVYNVAIWHVLFLFAVFSHVISQTPGQTSYSLVAHYRSFALDHASIPICFVATLPIFARDLIRFSHRLVGPLIRFREVMKDMAAGKTVEEVSLRRADLPSDYLAVFNNLVRVWNERLADETNAKSGLEKQELELVESA
jgi:hypothetical protein